MNLFPLRATYAAILALTMLSPAFAQQKAAPQPAPAVQPVPVQAPAAAAPTQAAPAPAAAAPVAPSAAAAPAESASPKSTSIVMRELSPWSMFMSADIIVKAVMIGLAFASLVTWTIFLAKMIELSVVRTRLRSALNKIGEARSLSEAQFALGAKQGVLTSLLAASMREARRIRLGMGLLATIGATSPFVGLFGTVWGIMNSFIGISKSQTTNLAVVAPGIAEALLATAIGLVAAIPAVIIYNHFARVTKGYIELVNRASGVAARLLSRDLDRTHVSSHGGSHSRAAE